MGKSQFTARIPNDLDSDIEDYCKKHDINRSEGGKQLLRAGVDAAASNGPPGAELDSRLLHAATHMGVIAVSLVVAGWALPVVSETSTIIAAGILLMIGAMLSGIVHSGIADPIDRHGLDHVLGQLFRGRFS